VITGWICPGCGNRPVPLDHFATTICGRTTIHPHYASAVLRKERDHYSRGSHMVSVTQGLGCPRKTGIMETESVNINPLDYNAIISGVAMHEMFEQEPHELCMVEHVFVGELDSIKVQGKPDMYWNGAGAGGEALLEDWKCPNDFGKTYLLRDGPKTEYIVQLSLYAELISQNKPKDSHLNYPRPEKGILWYQFRAHGLVPTPIDLWSYPKSMMHRPYGSEFTVAELMLQTDNFYRKRVRWQDLPLAGEKMLFGAKDMCDFCPVSDICKTEARGAPF